MPVTVGVNSRTVVHAASGGITVVFPDVCLTPVPSAPPVPIPYPNVAQSSDTAQGASSVKADGNPICHKDSNFARSSGDEPGTNGGIISGTFMDKAEFISYSFDVKVEGKNVARALDLMLHPSKNTPPSPVIQPPLIVAGGGGGGGESAPTWDVKSIEVL
ncbi:MAG: DUF4150 domain-containing protein [Polyangiaceae bacterium]|nr:DUF4150 domain-containing protein [Polyangiaceae bacterium]